MTGGDALAVLLGEHAQRFIAGAIALEVGEVGGLDLPVLQGKRVVYLHAPLIADLAEYKEATGGTGLVLATREGGAMNPSNVRRDIWHPLLKRAQVRMLDAYSLRHTFATLARTARQNAFDVAHVMGHSKCSLVDQVYAHATREGGENVAQGVGALVFGSRPQLRAIDGGAGRRQAVASSSAEGEEKAVTG